ncbi:MAG TPA: DMT family transporter [Acidimicrobiales bacterium]|nr:DMT family transporter [Acidimicrobiales bacterium]
MRTTRVGPKPPSGVALAAATAGISGVAVFVNSYGVRSFHQAAVYTTAKNIVAALLLAAGVAASRPRARVGPSPAGVPSGRGRSGVARWAALAYVAAVGGGLAFVLFFDGLATTPAVPAAFLHDTLVVWVAVLALPFLGERIGPWNVVAIGLLVVGQASAGGGVGRLAARPGELLVLGATILWAVEVVVAKRLLAAVAPPILGLVRMGGGAAALIAYLAATGRLHPLLAMGGAQLGWALLTGCLLAGYVGTWMAALARGRAVDVTSVLVGAALVTAILNAVSGTGSASAELVGLGMVAAGVTLVVRRWPRTAALT